MRWIWSGLLMAGMLLVLWNVLEARQAPTPDPTRYYEDGTGFPPTPTPKPPAPLR